MNLSGKPDKLIIPFANSGAKVDIPVESQIGIEGGRASLTDGFPPLTRTPKSAGGIPPWGTDANGILYEISAGARWAQAGGAYPFDSDFATDPLVNGYPKGARILRTDGEGYWLNTVDGNFIDPEGSGAVAAGWVPDYTNGAASVTMTNSNHTLTPLEYGKPIIDVIGLLTADLNLIFPDDLVGDWVVLNGTTGSHTITAKTATGTGVLVAQGEPTQIISDGINISSREADLSNTSSISKGAALVGQSVQIISTVAVLRTIQPTITRNIFLQGSAVTNDGNQGLFYGVTGQPAATYVDNGVSIIVPSGGDGSAAWLRFSDFAGVGTIASATTTNIGTVPQSSVTITGTVPITSFGNAMPLGTAKFCTVESANLLITPSVNIILSTGFGPTASARPYVSQAGDFLLIRCTGTSGGNKVYSVTVIPINGRSYQDNSTAGERQNFTIVPNVGSPNLRFDIFNCGSLILTLSGDTNQQGIRSTKTVRIENASQTSLAGGLPNPNGHTYVDLARSGLGGLDTGTVAANTDYWIHGVAQPPVSGGEAAYDYVCSLNPIAPDNSAFPTYTYSACVGFISTNGSTVISQIQKVNFKTSFRGAEKTGRLLASGTTPGGNYIAIPLTKAAGATSSIVSPQAYYYNFTLKVGTGVGLLAAVATDAANLDEVCYLSSGGITGNKVAFPTALDGAYVYYKSTDPNAELRLRDYDDVV